MAPWLVLLTLWLPHADTSRCSLATVLSHRSSLDTTALARAPDTQSVPASVSDFDPEFRLTAGELARRTPRRGRPKPMRSRGWSASHARVAARYPRTGPARSYMRCAADSNRGSASSAPNVGSRRYLRLRPRRERQKRTIAFVLRPTQPPVAGRDSPAASLRPMRAQRARDPTPRNAARRHAHRNRP